MGEQTQQPGAGLAAFFEARSIAVIGASDEIAKIGGRPVHMLAKHGYAGPVYPINPKGGVIQGLPAYASVLDTPAAPELAILAVPAAATPAALRDCAARGVQAAIVLSSGFVEAGPEGAALQAELAGHLLPDRLVSAELAVHRLANGGLRGFAVEEAAHHVAQLVHLG